MYAPGVHYAYKSTDCRSTETARNLGKPLWSSEDGPWRGDWQGACTLAKIYNKNYINGKMTKTIIWSLVSSYYENLPLPNSGVMMANTPWSGSYEVQPATWATAHTTQFAQPGWNYIDSGCGYLNNGGSFVTLKKPDGSGDYSIIIETIDASQSQTATLNLTKGLSTDNIHVWRTNETSHFIQLSDISPTNGSFTITLDPASIYSLTTTTGQKKGYLVGPAASGFPFPYTDNFENYTLGKQAKYFSDQGGTFEVANRTDRKGKCLRQIVIKKGIEWAINPYPETFIGSNAWTDYEVSSDVYIENSGFVSIIGRIGSKKSWSAKEPNGYWLRVDHNGKWHLKADTKTLALGTAAVSANTWHTLKLKFFGINITAFIDDVQVASVHDVKYDSGMAGVGSGWNNAQFDNFTVLPVAGRPIQPLDLKWINLALGKKVSASSELSYNYNASKAVDDDPTTRWSATIGTGKGQWLEIDFGTDVTFDKTITRGYKGFLTKYKIQYRDGSEWIDAIKEKDMAASPEVDIFKPLTAGKIRLYFTSVADDTPSVWEFEVYNSSSAVPAEK
ncbi:MAG: discoidin domain-containing protein [Planctomycetota bacterium]